MMSKTQKILSIILVLCMLIPFSVVADEKIHYADAYTEIKTVTAAETVNCKYQPAAISIGEMVVGSYVKFADVDFKDGNVTKFCAQIGVSPDYDGGSFDVYIDSINSTPVASMSNLETTGGWSNYLWRDVDILNSEIIGVHDVYIVFNSRACCNFRSLKFERYTGKTTDKSLPFDIKGSGYEEKYTLLLDFGVLTSGDANNYYVDKPVTAYDFLSLCANVMNGKSRSVDADALMKRHGLSADDNINRDTATKVAIDIMGYNMLAKASTAYNAACINYIEQNKVFEGVKAESGVFSRGDTISFIYNLLFAKMAIVTQVSTKGVYVTESDKTIIEHYIGIYSAAGIVEGNKYTLLTGASDVKDGCVKIGETIFAENNTSASELLGYRVKYYYKEDDGEYTLVKVFPYRNEELTIQSDDVLAFAGRELRYIDADEEEQTVSVNKKMNLIYNNVTLSKYDAELFTSFNGDVKLIDNNADGEFDVIIMSDTYDLIVKTYTNGIIYGKGTTDKVDLTTSDIVAVDQFGNSVTPEQLKAVQENSVLTIGEAVAPNGRKLYNISVVKRSATGAVDMYSASERIMLVNGKEYKISNTVTFLDGATDVSVGDSVRLYLNAKEEIAFITVVQNEPKYGYLMGVGETARVDNKIQIKIFTQNNKVEILDCHTKVKIDNKIYKTEEEIKAQIQKGLSSGNTLVIYVQNVAGKVSSIDFPYDLKEFPTTTKPDYVEMKAWENKNSLHLQSMSTTAVEYHNYPMNFSGEAQLKSSSLAFAIAPAGYEDESVFAKATDYIISYSDYKYKAYSTNADGLTVDVYVFDQFSDYSEFKGSAYTINNNGSCSYGYITSVRDAYNAEKEEVYKRVEYYDAKKAILKENSIENAVYNNITGGLEPGDAIRIPSNITDEYLPIAQKYYDAGSDSLITDFSANDVTTFSSPDGFRYGEIEKIDNTFFTLANQTGIYNIGTAKIFIQYKSNGKTRIKEGSISDLLARSDVGTGSRVVITSYYGRLDSILVIQ